MSHIQVNECSLITPKLSQNNTSEDYQIGISKASVSHLKAIYGFQMAYRCLRDTLEKYNFYGYSGIKKKAAVVRWQPLLIKIIT
jgi:hypothetical protein